MEMQFTVSWMFLAFMVVGFSLAVFGSLGMVIGMILVGIGAYVYSAESRPRALRNAAVGVVVALLLICLGLPMISRAREDARRAMCANNLKQIGLALYYYQDRCDTLFPVRKCDAEGEPLHSWRVMVLSCLDCSTGGVQYDRSEPWNGPKNISLAKRTPDIYSCSKEADDAQQGITHYVAVTGVDGAWLEPTSGDYKQSNPVRVVEVGSPFAWMEPRDVSLEDICIAASESSASELSSRHIIEGDFFFYDRPAGANALFADGTVRLIPPGVPVDVLRAALAGDRKQQEKLDGYAGAPRRLNWPNCGSLAGLIVCFIAMLAWPRSKRAKPSESTSAESI
jgi:hypothetical protein